MRMRIKKFSSLQERLKTTRPDTERYRKIMEFMGRMEKALNRKINRRKYVKQV